MSEHSTVVAPDVTGRPLAELLDLSGRVALVTGGARGIGAAIALRLAEAGASVVIGDLDVAGASETAARIEAAGGRAHATRLDVTDAATVDAAVEAGEAAFGPVAILVNNAGVLPAPTLLEDIAPDAWERTMRVNVTGVVTVSRAVARRMVAQERSGVIVNLASTSSHRMPGPGTLPYAASKHAVHAVTKGLAVELGPKGIRVFDIAPTVVETPGLAELRDKAAAAARARGEEPRIGQPDAFAFLPLGRTNVPDDVARIVALMVSDAAIMVTGCSIAVDAGHMVVR